MSPEREDSGELLRLHAQIHGLVQGVNFRWYTQRRAQDLGVHGWVHNLPDGSVEVLAEGTRGELEALLEWLRVGPTSAAVESVDAQWSASVGEFQRFEIRH